MKHTYTVTYPATLRTACIKNNWFTAGDSKQYEKLFYANEHGATLKEIATIIWLCSDTDEDGTCRRDILAALRELEKEYLDALADED